MLKRRHFDAEYLHGIHKGITFAMCFSWYRFKVNWIGLSGDKSIFFVPVPNACFSVYLIKSFHVNFLWRDNESRMNECFLLYNS